MKYQKLLPLMLGTIFLLLALWLGACGPTPTRLPSTPGVTVEQMEPPTEEPTEDPTEEPKEEPMDESGAAAYAVDLIASWVNSGAPQAEPFDYEGVDGNTYSATYEIDIAPLFTGNNVWFEGSQACTGCHFAVSENSYHEMDMSSFEGVLAGADGLEDPPGVSILGESEIGAGDFDWSHSKLRERLRNNRMPPGWEFDITEANRNGPCLVISTEGAQVQLGQYDCELNAVGLIGAWVESGAPDGEFDFGGETLTFERDVLPFFTQNSMWFEGSQACTGCHFAVSENSYHEMDLSSYAGIMTGADALEDPPGVSILGESTPGAGDFDWSYSKLRERLRNNRMAPGWEFDITEANRNGPLVLHGEPVVKEEETALFGSGECKVKAVNLIAAWVEAGAPQTDTFDFTAEDDSTCEATYEADIAPLFTENNVWFEGSQACTGCHFAVSEKSYHEMDMSSFEGVLAGADGLEDPPGVSILGESQIGAGDFDWSHSKLRERLRNNRMPPGWEFDITEANRNGPCLTVSSEGVQVQLGQFDCEFNAVGLIGAWVEAGAPDGEFDFGGETLTFKRDVLPFFTQNSMWFEGSQACTGCHFAVSENSYHEMDLSSYAGIMAGADALEDPPGVSILGESAPGAGDFGWSHSKLRERLRNNRMSPGWEFDITEANRNGPTILAGKKK